MENQSNQKYSIINDYIALFFVLGVSALFVYFTFLLFDSFTTYPEFVNWNYAYCIGGILALLYQIVYLISGGWTKGVRIFLDRWTDFFGDIRISVKLAISSILENYIRNGISFILYIFLFLSTINMCVHGFQYLVSLYGL